MSSVTKTWSWDTTIDGWAGDGGSGYVATAYNAGGDSGGCLLCNVSGESDSSWSFSTLLTSRTGETWATWGVPAGNIVTNIQISAWKQKVAGPYHLTSHKVASVYVTNSGVAVSAALLSNVSMPTSVTAWGAGTAGSAQSVGGGYQASNTAVRLAWTYSGVTAAGGYVSTYFDTVALTITYSVAAVSYVFPALMVVA